MPNERNLDVERSNPTGGGAGYRFNYYSNGKRKEKKRKDREKEPPVKVCVKDIADDNDAVMEKNINDKDDVEKNDYSTILKKQRKSESRS